MGLLERIAQARDGELLPDRLSERSSSIDYWLQNYLLPASGQFGFGGASYPYGVVQTWSPQNQLREVMGTLPGYSAALRACPPAFAAQLVRAAVLSQARFVFRNRPSSPTPRRTFGTRELELLERPWPNATTGQMLARLEWHAGLAGNAYVARQPKRLRVLRPDWVAILYGSEREPDDPKGAIDAEVLGYVYQNGGFGSGSQNRPQTLLPDEVAHWSPLPDPESSELGMSWITPALRDMQGDKAATEHKLTFFSNGATPNMVVKGIPATTKAAFDEIVEMMEARHAGVANAYRTLYLSAGADVQVVGSNLKELDFRSTQGAGETRIAMLSRVPAAILQIAEGLAGSTLNEGNFRMARRLWAHTWVLPMLQDLARSLAKLIAVPADAELWHDVADMAFMHEDAKDAADIEAVKANTINAYVKEGFTPESAIAAVVGQNPTLLRHSGLVSVQLQPPGTAAPAPGQPAAAASSNGKTG